ncbi:MAG: chromate transporter [Butyrivibrio sp.]|uniref:chromate transporter n=1 Tax=Butyrivibrio sp. TaxID=28121 RepID=UPI001B072D62|nr:chromate transporter [Butyrivibrio sp.]MBO6239612.1 chromate transporter [Butyrivibrio sp.]
MSIYLELFFAFLQVGAFSFGGGYAAMPLISGQVVDKYGWLSSSEFADLVTIAEMTPGPIAVNAATFVGNQTAGILGATVATIGVILPSCIFVTVLALLYARYKEMPLLKDALISLRPAVVSMIFAAGLSILIPTVFKSGSIGFSEGNLSIRPLVLFVLSVFALRKLKLNPILVMVMCGVVELAVYLVL